MSNVNLWPYIFAVYALALAAAVATWIMSQMRSKNPDLEEAVSLGLGGTVGLAVASLVLTLGVVLG